MLTALLIATAAAASPQVELLVSDGAGSGRYTPGATVHTPARYDADGEIVLGWTGDTGILHDPTAWNATATVPRHAAAIAPDVVAVDAALSDLAFELAQGTKGVSAYVPADPVAVLMVFHGTNDSRAVLERAAGRALLLHAAYNGYAVVALNAAEVDEPGLSDDVTLRWNIDPTDPDNLDLANVWQLLDQMDDLGWIEADTPRFAIGMSNGGFFAASAGVVPALGLDGVALYCAEGATDVLAQTTTPTAWYLASHDSNVDIDNHLAIDFHAALLDRGVASDLAVLEPSPLTDQRMLRVPGVHSVRLSAAIADDLRAGGFVDDDGFIRTRADLIRRSIRRGGFAFDSLAARPDIDTDDVLFEVKNLTADHGLYDDSMARTFRFLEEVRADLP